MVRHRILLGVFALAIGTGTTWATNKSLALSLGSGTLTCNTNTGATGSVLLTVTGSATATYPLTVSSITFTNPGLTVTASNGNATTLTGSTSKVTYTVAPTANCSGFTGTYTSNSDAWSTTITSSYGGTGDATQAVTVTETDTAATPLSTSAGAVNISCILNPGGTYTAGSAQFYLYTAAAIGSSATFSTLPPWLTLNGSSSAGPFTVPFTGGLQMTAAVSSGACATIGGLGST